jgi:hypothetical protein
MRYFYIPAPPNVSNEFVNSFGPALNAAIKDSGGSQAKMVNVAVLGVNLVKKQSCWGYHFKEVSLVALGWSRKMQVMSLSSWSFRLWCFCACECSLASFFRLQ